jgi:hypothetical protein
MPFLKQLLFSFLASHYVMGFVSSLYLPKDYQEGTSVPAVVNDLHSKTLNCMTGNSFSHKMLCTVELGFGVPSLWVFFYILHVFTILPELL